ncbi:hypothetical protein [Rhodopila globiformis]|uniref:Uncharacterized protein n=1 Tax=Rhodopila globiformis TaxID=1071 RepID=A0A2S6NMS9_RHOGL|nr:hypothetical protein [Rhodopila globiformis]PPQ37651.1 hypothetical protein CCS01_03215 [Rhodopila globiformis]
MGMAANPILSTPPAKLRLSEHARFMVEEHAARQNLIQKLATSPTVDYQIDETSGNYVFRSGDFRIVARRDADGSFFVLSIIDRSQFPT